MRTQMLREMSKYVRDNKFDIRGIVILRHGRLVFEWYAGGVTRDHNHITYSVTKSVVGTLAGVAIDRGELPGTDAKLSELFPREPALKKDARKARITLSDLLTMRSGLPQARAANPGPQKDVFERIHRSKDRTATILELKMAAKPGERFAYGNAEPQLVNAILRNATEEEPLHYARRVLFAPMDFSNTEWVHSDQTGLVPGGYGLRLRVIDMAKLGQLYLQGGRWGDDRIISEKWIKAATSRLAANRYGYYWWTNVPVGTHSGYAAKGLHGQLIHVIPELDIVFAAVSELPQRDVKKLSLMTERFVVGAVASDGPLPNNAQALKELTEELARAASYIPAGRENLPPIKLPQLPAKSPEQ
ncbi:serine hydrolase domain-containing protein [Thalassoglobus neptunius]|nr:serine hydrolase [Thalassoglobus neptunius]